MHKEKRRVHQSGIGFWRLLNDASEGIRGEEENG
jgi:hypothetical protein